MIKWSELKSKGLKKPALAAVPVLVALTAVAIFAALPENDTFLLEGAVEIASRTCYAQAGGRVEEMLVETGQPVKKGDVLAVIDDRAVDEQTAQLEQQVKIKAAQVKQLQAQTDTDAALASRRAAESNVTLWEENLAQAQRGLAAARQELADQKALYDAGAIARTEYDRYRQAADAAQSRVVTTQAQLESAKSAVEAVLVPDEENQVAAAQAELELICLQLSQLETSREDYQIRAFSDGVVISTTLEEGAAVIAGQSAFQLSDGKQQYAVFYLPQEYLPQAEFGREMSLYQQGSREEAARGRVCFIDLQAVYPPEAYENDENRNERSVKIKVELEPGAEFDVGEALYLRLETVQE